MMFQGVSWHMVAFEAWEAVLLVICLVHAWNQGEKRRERFAIILTGVLYGLTLETLTIYQLHAYYYGTFLVMVAQVPLAIAVGWGIIIYSATAFADSLRVRFAAWVAIVGLLGLNIDLSMDAVAIRVHMWNWMYPNNTPVPLTAQWFGVPYGNFYSWFIVLASFAALFRWLKPGEAKTVWGTIGKSLLSYLGSLIILVVLDQIYYTVFTGSTVGLGWTVVAVEIVGSLIIIALDIARGPGKQRDSTAVKGIPAFGVPFAFHVYFTTVLLTLAIDAGFAAPFPLILGVSGTMLLISFALHFWRKTVPITSVEMAPVAVTASD